MTGVTRISRCGTCHFATIVGQDITKRLCRGAPPTAIQVPAPSGQMTLRMARPIVSVSDEACGLYQNKSTVDRIRDDEAAEIMQGGEVGLVEVKPMKQ